MAEAHSGAMTSEPMRFQDAVAVVTVAGRGMGRAVARRLAGAGATVVVAELDPATGQAAAEELEAAGHSAISVATDVSRAEDVTALFQRVRIEFGRLDILINNAGINVARPLVDYTEVEWDRQFAVNMKSMFLCTQAAARLMIERRRGKIVNFASTAALVSSSTVKEVAYDSSKGAVRQFTISSAGELAPHGINVNAVAPGTILTEMSRRSMETPRSA